MCFKTEYENLRNGTRINHCVLFCYTGIILLTHNLYGPLEIEENFWNKKNTFGNEKKIIYLFSISHIFNQSRTKIQFIKSLRK